MATQKKPKSVRSVLFQRHYNYYMEQYLAGRLSVSDVPQCQLAAQRERDGLVKPLPGRKPVADID